MCKIKHSSNISVYFHISAIDLGTSSSIFGVLSSPLGITRHNMSYDEHMDTPMNSPPPDMTVNMLWKDPVIPQHKFRNTAEVLPCFFVLPLPDRNCFGNMNGFPEKHVLCSGWCETCSCGCMLAHIEIAYIYLFSYCFSFFNQS